LEAPLALWERRTGCREAYSMIRPAASAWAADHQRDEGDRREPPVDEEQVAQREQRRNDRGGQLQRRVRHEMVERLHVIAHGLLHHARRASVEPAQRDTAQAIDQNTADAQLEVVLGVVADGVREDREHQPEDHREAGDPHDHPRATWVRTRGEDGAPELDNGDERDDADRGGDRLDGDRAGEFEPDRSDERGRFIAAWSGSAVGGVRVDCR
jgi:hypothetical protein